jgi:hypothetical protein
VNFDLPADLAARRARLAVAVAERAPRAERHAGVDLFAELEADGLLATPPEGLLGLVVDRDVTGGVAVALPDPDAALRGVVEPAPAPEAPASALVAAGCLVDAATAAAVAARLVDEAWTAPGDTSSHQGVRFAIAEAAMATHCARVAVHAATALSPASAAFVHQALAVRLQAVTAADAALHATEAILVHAEPGPLAVLERRIRTLARHPLSAHDVRSLLGTAVHAGAFAGATF